MVWGRWTGAPCQKDSLWRPSTADARRTVEGSSAHLKFASARPSRPSPQASSRPTRLQNLCDRTLTAAWEAAAPELSWAAAHCALLDRWTASAQDEGGAWNAWGPDPLQRGLCRGRGHPQCEPRALGARKAAELQRTGASAAGVGGGGAHARSACRCPALAAPRPCTLRGHTQRGAGTEQEN